MKKENKTVWIISQYAIPIQFGFGTRHFYLGKEFVKKGMNVHLFAANFNKIFESVKKYPDNSHVYNYDEYDGVKVCWIRGFRYKKNEGLGRIFSWFVFSWRLLIMPTSDLKKPDVIILSSLSLPPIIVAYLFKIKFGAKLIFEIRDIWPLTLIDIGKYSKNNPFVFILGLVEKFGYMVSDVITATMPAADLHIKEVINKPFRFKCTPQGIDLEALKKNTDLPAEFVNEYIPKNKFIIGYAGALGASNALETVILAMQQLERKYTGIHLVFLGEGPAKPELEKLAENSKNISFAPKVKKENVISFLEKCDVVYDSTKHVSIYKYGLSRNKWMDYMYSAKPLLVSYSGYLSLINEADCGVIVESGNIEALKDAIVELSKKDKSELIEMGRRGKEYLLKNRTFDVLANEYAELFDEPNL